MKVLLLQLSDMHCNEKSYIDTFKIKKIADAVNTIPNIEKIILIVSGDLTQSADKREFSSVKKMIDALLSTLGELNGGYIDTMIVPGNHDFFLPDGSRTGSEIKKWNYSEHIDDEMKRLNNFFAYANSKGCFCNDKFFDVKDVKINNCTIRFILLNTALFSSRDQDDKLLHYLPPYIEMRASKKPDATLNVIVAHHPQEWFVDESKKMIKRMMSENDIVFFGHDHCPEALSTEYDDGRVHYICNGGIFNNDNNEDSYLNAVIFDDENRCIQRAELKWNKDSGIFNVQFHGENVIGDSKLKPQKSYIKNLLYDANDISDSLSNYYVFPRLERVKTEKENNNQYIYDVDELFEIINNEDVVKIKGKKSAGKTALIRYLYNKSVEHGFTPLLIEERNYRDSRIEKMLKGLFEEQYGENIDFDLFKQSNQQIIFIDDIDSINNKKARNNLIKCIRDYGYKLIYSLTDEYAEEDIAENVKNSLTDKPDVLIEIRPFYKKERDELIRNIGNLYEKDADTSNVISAMDYLVQCRTTFFDFTPGNMIQFIKCYFNGGAEKVNSISLVFETNIRNKILSACTREEDASIVLHFLEYLANDMYFNKRTEVVTFQQFESIISEFKEKRRIKTLSSKNVADICYKARILIQDDSFNVHFNDNNTYAYFVANAINTEYEKNPDKTEKIDEVFEYICFGINDTIIQFMTFIRNNTNLVLGLAKKAESIMEEYPEWSLSNNNLPFLFENGIKEIKAPSKREKNEMIKQQEQEEETLHNNIEFRGIFDFDIADANKEKYQVQKAFKYTQLVGRVLIDQYGRLDRTEVDDIVHALFVVPEKVIFSILHPMQESIEETAVDIANTINNGNEEPISTEKVKNMLGRMGLGIALSIKDDIAFNSTNTITIDGLNKPEDSINYDLTELMMKEQLNNSKEFIEKAKELFDKYTKNSNVKRIISLIARKHCIYNDRVTKREIDQLVSYGILGNKRSLLVTMQKS